MQHDEIVWQVINHQFCSFKSKVAKERTFCRNVYNVTGLCIKSACPLANSRYATIREEQGICYLYMKTAERAHTPKDLWEKIKLPANYTKALEIVSEQLQYFPKYLIHRNKQRLTKIHQMIIRMRKLKLKAKPKIVTTNTKVDRREVGKERKALQAAQLDRAIENELLERLKQVSEGEIYNYPEKSYTKVMSKIGEKDEMNEEDEEMEEDAIEEELEDEIEEEGPSYNIEYVEDFEMSDNEDDVEDFEVVPASKRKMASSSASKGGRRAAVGKSKGARVEVEYEQEDEGDLRERVAA